MRRGYVEAARAALAVAVDATQDFCQDAAGLAAARQDVAVIAMRREDVVAAVQRGAGTCASRLLADVDVDVAANGSTRIVGEPDDRFLEATNAQHCAEQLERRRHAIDVSGAGYPAPCDMLLRVVTPARWQWIACVVCVLLALIVKAPQMLVPMGQDQGLYHTVATEILHGSVLYRDAWDPKPPGVFYVHAAVLSLQSDPWRLCQLGPLQPRCGSLLFGVIDFVFSIGLGGLVWLVARRLGLGHAVAVLAFGFTAVFSNLVLLDPEGSTPEKYALAPAVGVILAGLTALESRRRHALVIAGVLGAIAALFKLPDLASLGAVSLVLIWQRRWRDLPWLWVPLAVVLLGVWVGFAALGAGAQMLDATLTYNLGRFGFQSQRIPFAAAAAAWHMFRDGLAVLWLPALLGAALAWQQPRWRLVVIWAACDVLALFLGGTKFTREYFVQLVPSLSLLAALAIHGVWTTGSNGLHSRAWLVLSLGTVALLSSSFQAGFTLRIFNEYVAHGWTTTSVEHLAAMIGGLPPGESLFVWGDEAELYTLSGRLPTTRFLNTAGLAVTSEPTANARRRELISNLVSRPPAVIVVDRRSKADDPNGELGLNVRSFPELAQLLAAQYREMNSAVLRSYVGGDREQVFVRVGPTDLCALMTGCRLS
jgi:hypothetical protein